jgi:hypothetical protein
MMAVKLGQATWIFSFSRIWTLYGFQGSGFLSFSDFGSCYNILVGPGLFWCQYFKDSSVKVPGFSASRIVTDSLLSDTKMHQE